MSRYLSRHQKSSRRQGLILLVFGLFLLGLYSVWRFHQSRILSFNAKEVAGVNFSTGIKPVYIKIYPLGVDVSIKEAVIKDGVWVIHPNEASHLITSAGIGDLGNMIIYGHNKNEILGPIRWIKEGAKIELKGSDGRTYFYEVVKIDTVSPDNLEYISSKNEEILTLYTCIGFLDSKRFMVVARRSDKGSD